MTSHSAESLGPDGNPCTTNTRGVSFVAPTLSRTRRLSTSERNVPVTFPKRDVSRVPQHWQRFGARVSPLTGSPRLAVNPPNAMLNYLYAILESEARLAAAELGLDPGIGVMHVDSISRDSLTCDLMEPIRPVVDAYVLGWIRREPIRREWVFEEHLSEPT